MPATERVPNTTRTRTTTRMILTTGLDPALTGGSGETGGTGGTGEKGGTGVAAVATAAWTTRAPHAPQNADVSLKGLPQVPQNLAMIDAPALSGGFELAWLVLRGVTHYAELRAITPATSSNEGRFGLRTPGIPRQEFRMQPHTRPPLPRLDQYPSPSHWRRPRACHAPPR